MQTSPKSPKNSFLQKLEQKTGGAFDKKLDISTVKTFLSVDSSQVLRRLREKKESEDSDFHKGPASPADKMSVLELFEANLAENSPKKNSRKSEVPKISSFLDIVCKESHKRYQEILGLPSTIDALMFTCGFVGVTKDLINFRLQTEKTFDKEELYELGIEELPRKVDFILGLLSELKAAFPFTNPAYHKFLASELNQKINKTTSDPEKQLILLSATKMFLKLEKKYLKSQANLDHHFVLPKCLSKTKSSKRASQL